jgi:hypothetical protein
MKMSAIAKLNEQSFVEDRNARDQYITKVDVLNKVKQLSLLPDGEHMTIKLVAEFYEVDKYALDKVFIRHREELSHDGMKILKGEDASKFNVDNMSTLRIPNKTITIVPRKAILRIGMLLRDSEVAKQVRTYLLNVEETASKEHRSNAVTYTNSWTTEEELILLDSIYNVVGNGGKLKDAAELASNKINRSVGSCQTRYTSKLKLIISDKNILSTIKNNKGNKKVNLAIVPDLPVSQVIEAIETERQPNIPSEIESKILSRLDSLNIDVLASLSSKKSSDELKLGIEKLKQEKMELMLSLNQLEYEMKLKEKINSDNVKELQTIVKEKDAEIKRQKSIANEYKTRSNNAMKSLNPTSQNKPVKKVNVKPDVQMKSERSGSRFRIVDGATVFMD